MRYDVEWRVIHADDYGFPHNSAVVCSFLLIRTPGPGGGDAGSKINE